jgi:hypothetical protein
MVVVIWDNVALFLSGRNYGYLNVYYEHEIETKTRDLLANKHTKNINTGV